MAKSSDASHKGDTESEIWNAIAVLEQLIEAMPDNQASLGALAQAYEQVGDHTRAKDCLLRLATIQINERDFQSAASIFDKVKAYAADDPRVKALAERLSILGSEAQKSPAEAAADASPPEKPTVSGKALAAFNISEEIALAWHLHQLNELTQEEYASVVQDLTEMSAGGNPGTVSVLHILQARGSKNLERIVVALSKECNMPIISLAMFDIRLDVASLLPEVFIVRRGALPFEFVGQNALLAVMNPRDAKLAGDVEKVTGRKCHFYMTLPSEFDAAVERIRELKKKVAT